MKIIILYGPTGIGKTATSLRLAKQFDAEIISCDSMQIYKYLDIGSAKIMPNDMMGIKHHLIDFVMPNQSFSVYDFVTHCKQAIGEIKSRGKNVVIVGGTGLYIKALVENYNLGEIDSSSREEFNSLSNDELRKIIEDANISLKNGDAHNRTRLLRYAQLAINKSKVTKQLNYEDYTIFGFVCDRQKLYDKINKRVDEMIDKGLVKEAEFIYKSYGENVQCFKAIGYKELLPYLKGETEIVSCIELIKQHSRNYAKRQFTFMNQFKNIIKVNADDFDTCYKQITKVLEEENNE